jgi:hypothetical protein
MVPVRRIVIRIAIAVLLASPPGAAAAQANPTADATASLRDRLDPVTRGAVQVVIDSASASGVPTAPLVAKALEGAAKHAPRERIVTAVRSLTADLSAARRALGGGADEQMLVAGAAALRAGASPAYLGELREARPEATVAWPLAVLADFVSHGVPVDTAGSIVLALTRAGATDAALNAFEQQVVGDIAAGIAPGAAAVARAPGGWERGAVPPASGSPPRPAGPRGRPPTPDVMRHH